MVYKKKEFLLIVVWFIIVIASSCSKTINIYQKDLAWNLSTAGKLSDFRIKNTMLYGVDTGYKHILYIDALTGKTTKIEPLRTTYPEFLRSIEPLKKDYFIGRRKCIYCWNDSDSVRSMLYDSLVSIDSPFIFSKLEIRSKSTGPLVHSGSKNFIVGYTRKKNSKYRINILYHSDVIFYQGMHNVDINDIWPIDADKILVIYSTETDSAFLGMIDLKNVKSGIR